MSTTLMSSLCIVMRGFINWVLFISMGLSLCLFNFKVRLSSGGEFIWNADLLLYLHFLDRKKDEFMALEQGGITVAAYEAKFHALSRYTT